MPTTVKPIISTFFGSLQHNRSTTINWGLAALIFGLILLALFYFKPVTMVIAVSRTDVSELKMTQSSTSIAVLKQMQPFFALALTKGQSAEPSPASLKGKTIGYSSSPSSN